MVDHREPDTDRLAVIALVILSMLLLATLAGLAYFLFSSVMPSLTWQASDHDNGDGNASASRPTPTDGNVTRPKAYICQYMTQNVTVLDADNGSIVDEIHLPIVGSGVAASHDGNYVYISGYDQLYVVDSSTDMIMNTIAMRPHVSTGFLAVSPDDRNVYVACQDGMEVISLNGSEGKPVAFTPGNMAVGIGISPDGKYVYTTDWSNCMLRVYNTSERRFVKFIGLIPEYYTDEYISLQGTPIKAVAQAGGIAVSPDGSRALVGMWYGTFISAVDLKAMALEKAIHLYRPSNRCGVYSPDGSRVYLLCYDYGVIFVLNSSTFEELNRFYVGPWPVSIAVTPDGKYLYVSYQQSNMEVYRLSDGARIRSLNFTACLSGTNIAFIPASV